MFLCEIDARGVDFSLVAIVPLGAKTILVYFWQFWVAFWPKLPQDPFKRVKLEK
jgi:hypothetical protein